VFEHFTKHLASVKVTVPVILLLGLVWLGFKADDVTVDYLDAFFITEVEAQTITSKVGQLEAKVDELADDITAQRIKQIETSVLDLRIKQCMSEGALKNIYATQIADLISEWRRLSNTTGTPATYVDCDDVG